MNRHFLALSVGAALAATVAPALAQSSGDVEHIVVTGTRTENLIQNVPNTTQSFSAEEIKEMGATSVRDILSRANNVQINAQKGGVNIRGLGFDYTVVLVNGRKPGGLENIKDFQSMITSTLNVNNIERIEVLRGQAGAMYGANALGGVINIITKQSELPSTVFSVTTGNSTTKVSMAHDFGTVGNWNGSVNASYAKVDGIEEESFSDTYDVFTNGDGYLGNINGTVGYQLNDNNHIRAELGYIVDRNKEYQDNTVSRDTNRSLISGALILDGFTEAHSYSTGLAYNRTENAKTMNSAFDFDDVFQDVILDGQNAWSINETHTLLMGGEYAIESAHTLLPGSGNGDTAVRGDELDKTLDRYALYLQDEMRFLNDRVFVIPSVRYDHHETFGGKATYQVGATWEVVSDHRLKVNVGNGYKAPTLMQLYGVEATGIGSFWGNPDLKPEESDNYELRYEYRGDRLNYAIGGYFNDITNYIHRECIDDPCPSKGANYLRVNLGQVEIKGIEAELSYQLTDALLVTASYNGVDGENIDDNGKRTQLSYTAKHIYGLDLGYLNYEHDLSINVWGNLNQDFNTGKAVFDYYNFSASAQKHINDTYSVSFGAYNFLQSERDSVNDSALDPMEWRVTVDMKI
ncbi:TonB-dependent receptor [Vibrio sp. SM6]|uniref:TonB-dependent receptor n=1 Tax=Vibrio agarilyticus TaxID=2726741 RepID=A0A7X8TQY0_9VIBR|nr:TonB-dependent receptor [Vibrio agarilyticus]NLS13203.1 TonB-dependent receptor [Vibrio agarilyticus]